MLRNLSKLLPALALAGCVTTGSGTKITAQLPDVPADIRTCFAKLVPAPVATKLTNRDLVQLVADLRASEYAKTDCGRRLLAFYDNLTAGLK
jgi:hypothetical protein